MTDRELIEGVSRRDKAAINYLVNNYQKRVIKTAYYFIGNLEDAEDLSQEIFIEIIKSISSFRCTSSLSTWIYRIIINRSINIIRKNNRRNIFSNIEHFFQITSGPDDKTRMEPSEKTRQPFLKKPERSIPIHLWRHVSSNILRMT